MEALSLIGPVGVALLFAGVTIGILLLFALAHRIVRGPQEPDEHAELLDHTNRNIDRELGADHTRSGRTYFN